MSENQPLALIIDDEEPQRLMLRSFLELKHWQVQEAEDGRAGLSALVQEKPFVVLLDLNMPLMDGFQFLKALRSQPDLADLPVIVVTAQRLTSDQRAQLTSYSAPMVEKGDFPGLLKLLAQISSKSD